MMAVETVSGSISMKGTKLGVGLGGPLDMQTLSMCHGAPTL